MKLYDENAFHYVFRVGIRERTRRVYLVEFDVITIERWCPERKKVIPRVTFSPIQILWHFSEASAHSSAIHLNQFFMRTLLTFPFPLAWLRYKVQYRLIIFPPGASSSSCSLKLKKIAFWDSHIVSYRWLVGPVPAAVDCVDRSYSNSRILPPAGCGCCLSNAAQQEEEAILLTSCTHLTGLVLLFLLLLFLRVPFSFTKNASSTSHSRVIAVVCFTEYEDASSLLLLLFHLILLPPLDAVLCFFQNDKFSWKNAVVAVVAVAIRWIEILFASSVLYIAQVLIGSWYCCYWLLIIIFKEEHIQSITNKLKTS